MTEGTRRRDWTPPKGKPGESKASEPTKLTEIERNFVGFVSSDQSKLPDVSSAPIEFDHAAWKEDVYRWMLERCTYRGRCFGRIEQLYADFRDWCFDHREVPSTPSGFVALLSESGFFFANGLISGIVLRDAPAVGRAPKKSRSSSTE